MPKHLNQNSKTEGSGRVQRQFKFKSTSTSSSRQLQPSSKNIQQTCYDPQLQGYFIWHCHLAHDPLAAPSLDHRCTLVQITYNTFKSSATSYKNIPKTEQWKTVNKLNCKTMTTVKTVAYIVQWVHMCPTACKWHQTTYKWKQLTSNPKQWNEHHMNWNHKTWRIQNCCNCQTPTKPMHSFCKIVGRLLQTELDPLTTVPYTASASSSVLTASVVPRTASAQKTWTTSNRNASKWKPTVASKFTKLAMTFKWVAMKFNWLAMKLERSAHPSFGLSWSALHSGQKVNLEINDLFSSIASLTWPLLSQKIPFQMPWDVVHQAYLGKKTSGKRLW